MPGMASEPGESILEGRLDDRVIDVLLEHPGTLAFNGLRRALQAHPEALARALRRLERDGLVRHQRDGYSAVTMGPEDRSTRGDRPRTLVASVGLPPGATAEAVLGSLAGRWFGSLRWLGVHDYPGEPTLVWSAEGGRGHVLLSVRRGNLRVRVDALREDPQFASLERSAYELLQNVLARIHRSPEAPPSVPGSVAFEDGEWDMPFGSAAG